MLIKAVDIPIDKLSMVGRAVDGGTCRRVRIESTRLERTPSSNNHFVRSYTTTD